ncbi:Alpha-l-rhamnosidase [Colletotrichum higginsianum IMI 349063]|uniref:alpha-L-rhamnosidase n=1 Tax=Colletotrichum higginsianum (strain IMI 349063) TaxID=759273 RepID=A0A1B7YGU5_COLHI|nr:Alpha-l-rhamnosidase [Colletotrichum higginsianum IMI 349063]OBR11276.1 Alpha-l-rhamnosidase [Colletotrichum higginsianum IMI 349063]
MAVSISQVTFEHHRLAFGIAESEPRISWRFDGNAVDWEQSAYDVEISRGRDGSSNIHKFNSSTSLLVPWPEQALQTAEQATVRARAHGKPGQPSTPWSDWVTVETGLLDSSDWAGAVPIAADRETEVDAPKRPIYFRKSFPVGANVTRARLYITALGIYEAEINGRRVGDYVLAPGWQSYNYRHVYDAYDVTELVTSGENAIGVAVGEGWFSGRLSYGGGVRNNYGDTIGLLSLLVVTLDDGSVVKVPTDPTWQANTGPVVSSEIYNGEHYDSTLEAAVEGWSSAAFEANNWLSVKELPALKGELVPPDGPPVRRIEERKPESIFESPSGKTIIDFGQNLVGWLRLTVSGPSGTNITLHHAEVLEDGELALRPLRVATAADSLILHGNGNQTWEPRFTFHGFRYAQIDGWPQETPLTAESVTAVVVHSDMEQTGWFECSNPLLNKFHHNVRWSMKGNFLSIPTDCPQRDERLGWTGDAHAFAPTANYLYDAAGFWKGWHKDIWSEMQRNGSMVVPFTIPTIPPNDPAMPAAVWGDVAVANPFNIYQAFGDVALLEEQYLQSQAWIDTGISRNEVGLWNRSSFQFADWLDPKAPSEAPGNATTAKHLVADAYLIHMTEFLANMSAALGRGEAAAKYRAQRDNLTAAFHDAWVQDGALANETQTAYAMALNFGLFTDEAQRSAAAEKLRQIVADNDYLVGTGFAGTPPLGFALRDIGATEDFYRMLLQTRVPSWLYQVVQNGTTTWERWDSLLANGTVNPGEMTSFNHYAFGSVANWMHQVIGGIAPAEPGWKRITVAPVPGGNITSANSKYISPYGEVKVQWWFEKNAEENAAHRNGFHLNVEIPPNTKADITLPNGGETQEVGSGYYEFHDPSYQLA